MSNKSNKKAYAPIKISKLGSLTDLTQDNMMSSYTDMVGMTGTDMNMN